MSIVDKIVQPISFEMTEFELRFLESMKSNVALLDKITQYIIRRKGKQMRPMFIFLTAKMLGEVNDKTYEAGALVELLHTATLVHDDVVDDADERRGFFSVNAIWKNKVAVLVGDYMLSRLLQLSIEKDNIDLLKIIAKAVRDMSEGELLQIEKARLLDITEEVYFEVIRQKTGTLIAVSCQVGAVSVNRLDVSEKMRKFGELVGLAFQIKDDIFDYGSDEKIGKPTGNDIRERKLTLPLIYVLNNGDATVRNELINIIKNHNEDSKKVKRAIQLVIEHGGISYAYKKMMQLANEALLLLNDFPDSDAKSSLITLVNYTTQREK
ncbi:MAG: polyprenyl synthetase family protein [Bacteroidota bacterium]